MTGFVYLASPYSDPDIKVRERRYRQACISAAGLMRNGHVVFSPIAHSHPVEVIGLRSVESGAFWKRQDVPLLRHADMLVVLMLAGWEKSAGIQWEIEIAESLMIPVRWLKPADPIAFLWTESPA